MRTKTKLMRLMMTSKRTTTTTTDDDDDQPKPTNDFARQVPSTHIHALFSGIIMSDFGR